jgi:hypothetical protein
MRSPWDDDVPENAGAVPDDLVADAGVETPLTPAEETQLWRQRADQLWRQSQRDGNTQGASSALSIAMRHLKAEAAAAEKAASAQRELPEETIKQIQLATLDNLVRASRDVDQFRAPCPVCKGRGDKKRIACFERWMQTEGHKDAFDTWNEATPNMSGTLEDTKGHFYDDDSNSSNPN